MDICVCAMYSYSASRNSSRVLWPEFVVLKRKVVFFVLWRYRLVKNYEGFDTMDVSFVGVYASMNTDRIPMFSLRSFTFFRLAYSHFSGVRSTFFICTISTRVVCLSSIAIQSFERNIINKAVFKHYKLY